MAILILQKVCHHKSSEKIQTLVDNRQVIITIYRQRMCNNLVLFNAPLVVTLYILLSIRKVYIRKEETMLCHVWLLISNRWSILWFLKGGAHYLCRKLRFLLLYESSFDLLRLDFTKSDSTFICTRSYRNVSGRLLNILRVGYHNKYI